MLTVVLGFLNDALVITGSVGAIYSAWNWWQQRKREKRLDETVTIRLCDDVSETRFHSLGVRPVRRNITRAEVLGFVGMVPTHRGQRFTCAYTSTQEFIDQIELVFDGESDVIELFFTEAEKAVFDLQPAE